MPTYLSTDYHALKERLITDLAKIAKERGAKAKIARKAGMSENDLNSVFRHDRTMSLSKLLDVAKVMGLDLHAEWRPK